MLGDYFGVREGGAEVGDGGEVGAGGVDVEEGEAREAVLEEGLGAFEGERAGAARDCCFVSWCFLRGVWCKGLLRTFCML